MLRCPPHRAGVKHKVYSKKDRRFAIVKKKLDRFLGVFDRIAETLNGKPISH